MPLTRRNYILLAVGFAVILPGFRADGRRRQRFARQFNYAMFSWRRITLAPITVIGGFVIEIYAIMKTLRKIIRTAVPAPRPPAARSGRGTARPPTGAPVRRDGTGDIPA